MLGKRSCGVTGVTPSQVIKGGGQVHRGMLRLGSASLRVDLAHPVHVLGTGSV